MKREDFLRAIAVDPAEVARLAEAARLAEEARRAEEARLAEEARRAAELEEKLKAEVDFAAEQARIRAIAEARKDAAYASRAKKIGPFGSKAWDAPMPEAREGEPAMRGRTRHHEPEEHIDEPVEYEIGGVTSRLFDEVVSRHFTRQLVGWFRDSTPGLRVIDVALDWLKPYAVRHVEVEAMAEGGMNVGLDFSPLSATKLVTGSTRWEYHFRAEDLY